MATELSTRYDPQTAQARWYDFWRERGYFHAEADCSKPMYSIVIPPPNVTGRLHMGHALNNSLQDALIRWKRMDGFNACWLPGTDHAGIATQFVVERKIREQEKLSRHDIGREEMIRRIWQWKEEHGDAILKQLEALGCSCDWNRTRFTLDEGLSRAVREAFVRLYEEGFIYRGTYLINWCPRCQTTISDDEVEHIDRKGSLYHMRYPLQGSEGEFVTVATTRPETMLGDTAVAVNPKDKRYHHLIGKTLILPLMNRPIPIIADPVVEMDFGTGAVKVTPAHDPNDFLMGQRHALEQINIFTETAVINENGGDYQGLDRYKARKQVLADLEKQGLLEKVEDYQGRVGVCYRCNTEIEPYLSLQWFLKMKPLMEEPIRAVREERVRFVPKSWENTYFAWVENIRDWALSRQIWWGHRMPVWYCDDCKEITVSREDPTECAHCKSSKIRQDEDVLDTWFSSSLWPFSTFGWPDKTPDIQTFYPTSTLVTAYDIIFFWVARMIMMGLKFMGDVPFRDVYITPLVFDEQGRKMSKSLGNAVDPIDLIERHGVDAVRFTLTIMAAQGRNINLSEQRIEGYRNFCNKIWNAARLALSGLDEAVDFRTLPSLCAKEDFYEAWIVSRLQRTVDAVRQALEGFRFNDACEAAYAFFWHEYCDWYLELAKPAFYGEDRNKALKARTVALWVLENMLRILHPVMPFITEEVWQKMHEIAGLKPSPESIMIAEYPKVHKEWISDAVETEMSSLQEICYHIRNIRGELGIAPGAPLDVVFRIVQPETKQILEKHLPTLRSLLNLSENIVVGGAQQPIPEASSTATAAGAEIAVLWSEDVRRREEDRLQKLLSKADEEIRSRTAKLENEKFISRAPEHVVQKERDALQTAEEEKEMLARRLEELNNVS